MNATTHPLDRLRFLDGPSWLVLRLAGIARRWENTPYMPGQRVRGVGVDCVQLVAAVYDELCRNRAKTRIPRLPPNSGPHDARAGLRTARAVCGAFGLRLIREPVIEPGDLLVTRASLDPESPRRMGHALIYLGGSRCLHAVGESGACVTSIAGTSGIIRIYRATDITRWI